MWNSGLQLCESESVLTALERLVQVNTVITPAPLPTLPRTAHAAGHHFPVLAWHSSLSTSQSVFYSPAKDKIFSRGIYPKFVLC